MLRLIIFLLFSLNVMAKDISNILVLKDLYIESEKHVRSNRSYYIPENEQPRFDLNLGMNLDIGKYSYFDTRVVSITNQRQFRFIAWEFENGLSYYGIDLYVRHFSGHLLDTGEDRRFPEDNTIGIRVNFVGGGRR